MQESLEQQLLTCQEMFLEIEQKVAVLSSLGAVAAAAQASDLGAVRSQQESTDLLCAKLKRLKEKLVSFQQLLQDRQEVEKKEAQQVEEQKSERHPQARLQRSSSVQEIFSSPRNKLLRQSSVQQQKELEQQLSEQRGLTAAIVLQSSRTSLSRQTSLENTTITAGAEPPAAPDDGNGDDDEEEVKRRWMELHAELLLTMTPVCEVPDSCGRKSAEEDAEGEEDDGGTAGSVTVSEKLLQEIQALGERRKELQTLTAAEGSVRSLDQDLLRVLHGLVWSLSSIKALLQTPVQTRAEEDEDGEGQLKLLQLQSLSAELQTVSGELTSLRSTVSAVPGSACVLQCVDDLLGVLAVVQAAVKSSEEQMMKLQQETGQEQSHQITRELSGTRGLNRQLQGLVQTQESLQLQLQQVHVLLEELDHSHLTPDPLHRTPQPQSDQSEDLRSSVEQQQQHLERLLHGFQEMTSRGSERLLTLENIPDLQSREDLRQKLKDHTKFFRFLVHHCKTLQYLTSRLPPGALHRWSGVMTGLQDEVERLQQLALDCGVRTERTLEIWTQWEKDQIWAESLLKEAEVSLPRVHLEGDSEELSGHKVLTGLLDQNEARFCQVVEAGLRLQASGCRGVGVATSELQTRWRTVELKVVSERTTVSRTRKLRHRFSRDSALLTEWMKRSRELVKEWGHVTEDEVEAERKRGLYLESVALSKELEARTDLKVSVMGAGSQLVQLMEAGEGHLEDDEDDETSDPHVCSVHVQLREIEELWPSLLTTLPVVQQHLHKLWMKTMTQQEALRELQVWLRAAESKLQEKQTSYTKSELTRLLAFYKELQVEFLAHQATLDHVNQPLQTSSTDGGHTGRYEHNQFGEEQGLLNYQWLSFHEKLNSQIQGVEQTLKTRSELEARLQITSIWITEQDLWMDSAKTPSSRTEVQRNINSCQALEEKIRLKVSVLQELRTRGSSDLMAQTDKSIQSCSDLMEQNRSLKHKLLQTQQLWDSVEKSLDQMMERTCRTSQTLVYHSDPQLHLQAHRDLHQLLQRLHDESESAESAWTELSQHVSSLSDIISPAAAVLLADRLARRRDSWTSASSALDRSLRRSLEVLRPWETFSRLSSSFSEKLQTLQDDVTSTLSSEAAGDDTEEQVSVRIHQVQTLLQRSEALLQSDLVEVLDASKALTAVLEPSAPAAAAAAAAAATALVQSESRMMSRGVLQLIQTLTVKLGRLQEELKQLREFSSLLESLESNLEVWEQSLDTGTRDQSELLRLSAASADLDVLNELSCSLTLGDAAAPRLRRLNLRWDKVSARAEEACSAMQTESLRGQSFQQKCESWMTFLQRMEDSLAVDVSGSYLGLRQQLRTHKRFQAEVSGGHQILHSVITDALHLLQRGEVDDRSDFLLKLAQLREHWQGAVQRAEQRRSLVEGLVKHWHLYGRSLRKLQRFLTDAQALLPPAGPPRCSLEQLRRSLRELQHTELLFQRHQCSFLHTLEVGRQLFAMGDEETQTRLQEDLAALQEEWENLHSLLGRRVDLTEAIIKNWERYEAELAERTLQLKEVKTRLNLSIPESDDELLSAEKFNEEAEDSLVDWAQSLTRLSAMKTDLSQYIIADDVLLLQEQVEHLSGQWEELCVKVSLRKQEIADRLNAWIIFNEKNKELCEWLTQMENKVAHNSDLNIEEMVEKLKKDCMEEINLFSENKTHLKALGEQLISASNKTKETEINDKLKDVSDRWKHLFDHIENRVRKLKETLVTVQQLDKNMSNLRTWLSRIEAELSKPVVYSVCHSEEIQRKLAEQQDLQRDIEQHTDSVASVLTLCDVLLRDADACGGGGGGGAGDAENDAIQQTTRSLDRRWRNICAMSMERRMRIEETWRLWCKFLDDYSRFEDWLRSAEFTAANPDSAEVLYTSAKEELKKFESFQRQVHERLTQLELVNKQYRRLARENRTDAASKLKVMVHDGNQRWDTLQRRVGAVLRRLKHFTSQREDFEGTREAILVWLTEMDLQLTNVEHFSESDVEDKMRQLIGFQQEITLNTNKIDALIVFGENLIQKSAPLDAALIEDELEELHSYCQEVFGRVARFHNRLVNRHPVLEEEQELSDRDTDLDEPPDLTDGPAWRGTKRKQAEEENVPAVGGVSAGRQTMCHLLVPPLERSGRETPVSVDSIPLEWDHTVDVGGSSSHEDEEDTTFFSTLTVTDPPSWHQPGSPDRKRVPRDTPTTSTPFHHQGYVKLMSECSGCVDSVKRVKLILNDEEEEEEPEELGLINSMADKHPSTGVIQRWELLQAQKFGSHSDIRQDLQQWQKLNSDLCDVTSWLGRVLPELERLQRIAPSTSVRDFEVNVRKLKEMQKTFNSYKCLMISVNLNSRHFLLGGGGDTSELQELHEALSSANISWTQACSGLENWEQRLRSALMQCQDFNETLHSLLLWLAQAEKKLHAGNASDPLTSRSALLRHRDALMHLQDELRSRQRQVSSLHDISSQLLLEATTDDSVEAKEKVHVISNKLRLLLREAAADLNALQGRLETCPACCEVDSVGLGTVDTAALTQKDEAVLRTAGGKAATQREERRDSPPRRPFFYRVLRAAFPLHLLFLVLLVLVCLVPMSEDDFSCTLSNNFARSFYPMLRYTNGPPPT